MVWSLLVTALVGNIIARARTACTKIPRYGQGGVYLSLTPLPLEPIRAATCLFPVSEQKTYLSAARHPGTMRQIHDALSGGVPRFDKMSDKAELVGEALFRSRRDSLPRHPCFAIASLGKAEATCSDDPEVR